MAWEHIGTYSGRGLVIAVGASAGGLPEIIKIVDSMPPWFEATMVIASHRTPDNVNLLLEILARRASIQVREPEDEECLARTVVYIGGSRDTVRVVGDAFSVKEDTSSVSRIRRIDDLFFSVAQSAGSNAVGVILSGMLSDGVAGLRAIHEAGGECLVQHPGQAAFGSMPENALASVPADFVGSTDEIAARIIEIAHQRRER
ncbi:MAG: chemotaxis protein CheB [Planctomycetota bacterium]